MTFEAYLAANDFGNATLTASQREALLAAWRAESAPPAAAMTDLHAVVAKHSYDHASRERVTAAVQAAATAGGDAAAVELAAMRASRPQVGVSARSVHASAEGDVLAASVCRTIGMSDTDLKRVFPAEVVVAADTPNVRGATIHTVVRHVLSRAGLDVPAKVGHDAIRAAMSLDIKAAGSWGPSTTSVSGVLGNVANKAVLAAYMAQASTWRTFARVGSVRDFKAATQYRLGGDLALAKVPDGGEIKHGTLSEESLSNELDTWAKMLGLSRKQLINDDLSVFSAIPAMMGRASARAVEKEVYRVFMNNSSFFTSGRGNVSTGGGSALSIAGLGAAIAKFRALKDADGEYIGVEPAVLLVPPTLESLARQLVSDMALIGAPTTPVSSANPWAPLNLQVVVSPYLEDTAYTGNSTAAWYLLAPPGDAAVANVNFLDGKDSPTIETFESDPGMLGMGWRCFFDFSASQYDYRGGVRSNGS